MAVVADSHRSFLIPEDTVRQCLRQRIFDVKIQMNCVILLCKLIITCFQEKINNILVKIKFTKILYQYFQGIKSKLLAENGMEGSMSAPGCPYDNSCVESFFATLKKELTFRRKYATIEDVKTDLYR